MTLRKALILLRLSEFDTEEFIKKHPEIGIEKNYKDVLDEDISDDQFFSFFTLSNDEHLDQGCSSIHGHPYTVKLKPFCDRGPSPFGFLNHEEKEVSFPEGLSISKTNEDWKIKIRIGMIIKCDYDYDYGIVLAQTSNWCGRERVKDNRVFYFDKDEDFFIPKYSLVAYVEDFDDSNKVFHVTHIEEFENYGGESVMKQGIPYISESSSCDLIGIPHIFTSNKILYYYNVFYDTYLYHKYCYLRTLKKLPVPNDIIIAKKLKEIKQYVDEFDFNSVIKTYTIRKSGYLQRRCGRDDHFNITTYKTINSNDSYIQSIVPLGIERDYTLGSSSDEDYDILETVEMEKTIDKAKEEYTTSKHFEYLRNEYISSIIFIRKEKELMQQSIENNFNIHETLSELKSINSSNYKNKIIEYNSKLFVNQKKSINSLFNN